MHFDNQLKRGYLGLTGLAVLALAALITPDLSAAQKPAFQSQLTASVCKLSHKHPWQLASTPIDIQPLLTQNQVCRA